jgi:WS/DGAT/MGAT family acyltransferase
MERMSGIDPMFIYSDTPQTPMEIAYACILDPSNAVDGYAFSHVWGVLQTRVPDVPAFRRRLVTVPLGLDSPRWVDDPEFDLANHVYRVALPSPGGPEEFTALVAEVMGRPLQPDQPPWEMHVIEGLAGGRVGLIAKVHHSVIDGVAGAELLARFLDVTAEGSALVKSCSPWVPPRLPSHTKLVTDSLPSIVQSPLRALRAAGEMSRTAVRLARLAFDKATGPVSIPLGAPPIFESPVSARRQVAFAELDLGKVRALKERYGSTINDVVLAVCSGALRAHLLSHGDEADAPLVAVVPVSVRPREEADGSGNLLSAMFVPLANDQQTPLERLRTVTAASASCKGQERAVGYGPTAMLMAEAIPPVLAKPLIQLGVRSGIMRKLRPGNLMVSNVPGPSFPLYFAGMELCELYPIGPVVEGVAVNVTVQSYRNSLFVGINASATTLEDLPELARAMVDELTLLGRMAAQSRRQSAAAGGRHHRPSGSTAAAMPGREPRREPSPSRSPGSDRSATRS